jgi:hypothetical protein
MIKQRIKRCEVVFAQTLAAEVELLLVEAFPTGNEVQDVAVADAYRIFIAKGRAFIRHPSNLLYLDDDARTYRDFPHGVAL